MSSHKEITKESYQSTAEDFASNVQNLAPIESIEKFAELLPPNSNILDIGCGSGRDAKIFSEKGFSVTGIDFSEKMIAIAKNNAPLANFQVMDIENLVLATTFDGVWACCSLCHISKEMFPAVLTKIASILNPDGYLYLALKMGSGEIIEKDSRYQGDHKKFWSYFEKEELESFLKPHFTLLECGIAEKKDSYQTHPALRVFAKKLLVD